MLDFMVIGLPRSGTTWAANWLTTDTVYCAHDPLYHYHYDEWNTRVALEAYRNGYVHAGVSCTGIWRWPAWVNAQPCAKLILERDFGEVQDSLTTLDLPRLDDSAVEQLNSISGFRLPYECLFDPRCARLVWEHLTGGEFNEMRHKALCEYMVQPKFEALQPDPEVTRKLYDELGNM